MAPRGKRNVLDNGGCSCTCYLSICQASPGFWSTLTHTPVAVVAVLQPESAPAEVPAPAANLNAGRELLDGLDVPKTPSLKLLSGDMKVVKAVKG